MTSRDGTYSGAALGRRPNVVVFVNVDDKADYNKLQIVRIYSLYDENIDVLEYRGNYLWT